MGCSDLKGSYDNGFEVVEKVTLSLQRYNALVAKEEQLRIVKDMLRNEKEAFGDYKVLRSILGITTIEAPADGRGMLNPKPCGRNLDE